MNLYTLVVFSILIKQGYTLLCPAGSYISSYGSKCYQCSKGRYQDQSGQSFCKWCNKGEYNVNLGRSTKCDICPAGHSCYSIDKLPVNCTKGRYQDQTGQRYCKWCKRGEFNVQIGRSTKCDICPVGHRCYSLDELPVKCPKGMYQDQTGQRYCVWCKKGKYNIQIGRSTKCDICPVGHRCYSIDKLPVKCPKGMYQDQKGQRYCKWCKRGEYNVQIGRSTKCDICPVGHRCYNLAEPPVKCAKGRYQDQKGQRYCNWCTKGEYNVQIGRSTKCDICPVGHRCYNVDELPEKCAKGMYQDQTGQRYCKWCSKGEYNIQRGQSECIICPVGHSCKHVDTAPVKCQKGQFQNLLGQQSCNWCEDGHYSLKIGSTKCEPCPAGSKCPYVDSPPILCIPGSYSPAESTKCFSCPSGSFCPNPSQPPIAPNRDTVIKSEIKKVVKYAAEAKYNPAVNGSGLTDNNNRVLGFVRYKGNAIVVAFRGTANINGWVNNAKFLKTAYQNCQGCKTHKGFLKTFNSVNMQMLARVSALHHKHPNSKVIVTGHSLGGALATLAAVELAKAGYNTDLITFGSPRVGNKGFSEYADKTLKSMNLRVTYKKDLVTVLPPKLIGYRHVGQEIHYTDQNTAYELPPKTDTNYIRSSIGDHKLVNYEKLN